MKLKVDGLSTFDFNQIKSGGLDAHGKPPVAIKSEGLGNPCRHCMQLINEGDTKLVLAYRPFKDLQPYAEVGPIFLHAADCSHYLKDHVPAWFDYMDAVLVRGYNAEDWIMYETAAIVPGSKVMDTCLDIFKNPSVQYIHVRTKYNCYLCRVDRD